MFMKYTQEVHNFGVILMYSSWIKYHLQPTTSKVTILNIDNNMIQKTKLLQTLFCSIHLTTIYPHHKVIN